MKVLEDKILELGPGRWEEIKELVSRISTLTNPYMRSKSW